MNPRRSYIWKAALRLGLALAYAWTQTAGASAAESAFWAERRGRSRSVRGEDAPAGLLAQLPVAAPAALLPISPDPLSEPGPLPDVGPVDPAWRPLLEALRPYGSVSAVHLSPSPRAPLVVHIQDAHGAEEAQRNIAGLLRALADGPGLSVAGLEGAGGPLDLAPYRAFPQDATTGRVAGMLLRQGLFTGSEYAGLTSPRALPLRGVEDLSLYQAHIAAFKESLARREEVRRAVEAAGRALSEMKKKAFSPALSDFDGRREAYGAGRESLGAYARALAARHPDLSLFPQVRRLISALDREKSLDFAAVEKERAGLIGELSARLSRAQVDALVQKSLLHRAGRISAGEYYGALKALCGGFAGRPRLAAYVDYVRAAEGISRAALLEELGRLEGAVEAGLVRTPEERRTVGLSHSFSLLRKLTDHALAPEEWAAYAARGEDAARDAAALGFSDAALLKPYEDFCALALRRNEALAGRLMEAVAAAPTPAGGRKTAALVTGGFHTPGLVELLEKKGASVIVVTPHLSAAPAGSALDDFFARAPLPLEKILAGEAVHLSPPLVTDPAAGHLEAAVDRVRQAQSLFVSLQAALRVSVDGAGFFMDEADRIVYDALSDARRLARSFSTIASLDIEEMDRQPNAFHLLRYSLRRGEEAPVDYEIVVALKDGIPAVLDVSRARRMDLKKAVRLEIPGSQNVLYVVGSVPEWGNLKGLFEARWQTLEEVTERLLSWSRRQAGLHGDWLPFVAAYFQWAGRGKPEGRILAEALLSSLREASPVQVEILLWKSGRGMDPVALLAELLVVVSPQEFHWEALVETLEDLDGRMPDEIVERGNPGGFSGAVIFPLAATGMRLAGRLGLRVTAPLGHEAARDYGVKVAWWFEESLFSLLPSLLFLVPGADMGSMAVFLAATRAVFLLLHIPSFPGAIGDENFRGELLRRFGFPLLVSLLPFLSFFASTPAGAAALYNLIGFGAHWAANVAAYKGWVSWSPAAITGVSPTVIGEALPEAEAPEEALKRLFSSPDRPARVRLEVPVKGFERYEYFAELLGLSPDRTWEEALDQARAELVQKLKAPRARVSASRDGREIVVEVGENGGAPAVYRLRKISADLAFSKKFLVLVDQRVSTPDTVASLVGYVEQGLLVPGPDFSPSFVFRVPDDGIREGLLDAVGASAEERGPWRQWIVTEEEAVRSAPGEVQAGDPQSIAWREILDELEDGVDGALKGAKSLDRGKGEAVANMNGFLRMMGLPISLPAEMLLPDYAAVVDRLKAVRAGLAALKRGDGIDPEGLLSLLRDLVETGALVRRHFSTVASISSPALGRYGDRVLLQAVDIETALRRAASRSEEAGFFGGALAWSQKQEVVVQESPALPATDPARVRAALDGIAADLSALAALYGKDPVTANAVGPAYGSLARAVGALSGKAPSFDEVMGVVGRLSVMISIEDQGAWISDAPLFTPAFDAVVQRIAGRVEDLFRAYGVSVDVRAYLELKPPLPPMTERQRDEAVQEMLRGKARLLAGHWSLAEGATPGAFQPLRKKILDWARDAAGPWEASPGEIRRRLDGLRPLVAEAIGFIVHFVVKGSPADRLSVMEKMNGVNVVLMLCDGAWRSLETAGFQSGLPLHADMDRVVLPLRDGRPLDRTSANAVLSRVGAALEELASAYEAASDGKAHMARTAAAYYRETARDAAALTAEPDEPRFLRGAQDLLERLSSVCSIESRISWWGVPLDDARAASAVKALVQRAEEIPLAFGWHVVLRGEALERAARPRGARGAVIPSLKSAGVWTHNVVAGAVNAAARALKVEAPMALLEGDVSDEEYGARAAWWFEELLFAVLPAAAGLALGMDVPSLGLWLAAFRLEFLRRHVPARDGGIDALWWRAGAAARVSASILIFFFPAPAAAAAPLALAYVLLASAVHLDRNLLFRAGLSAEGPAAIVDQKIGRPTLMTTYPGRNAGVDDYIEDWLDRRRAGAEAEVVDVGVGFPPVTTVQLAARLEGRARVTGVDINLPAYVVQFPRDEFISYLAFFNRRHRLVFLSKRGEGQSFQASVPPEEYAPAARRAAALRSGYLRRYLGGKLSPIRSLTEIPDLVRGRLSIHFDPAGKAAQGVPRLRFLEGNIRRLPVKGSVDVIRALNVFLYYDADWARGTLRSVGDRLKEGGLVIVGDDDAFVSYVRSKGVLHPYQLMLRTDDRGGVVAPTSTGFHLQRLFPEVKGPIGEWKALLSSSRRTLRDTASRMSFQGYDALPGPGPYVRVSLLGPAFASAAVPLKKSATLPASTLDLLRKHATLLKVLALFLDAGFFAWLAGGALHPGVHLAAVGPVGLASALVALMTDRSEKERRSHFVSLQDRLAPAEAGGLPTEDRAGRARAWEELRRFSFSGGEPRTLSRESLEREAISRANVNFRAIWEILVHEKHVLVEGTLPKGGELSFARWRLAIFKSHGNQPYVLEMKDGWPVQILFTESMTVYPFFLIREVKGGKLGFISGAYAFALSRKKVSRLSRRHTLLIEGRLTRRGMAYLGGGRPEVSGDVADRSRRWADFGAAHGFERVWYEVRAGIVRRVISPEAGWSEVFSLVWRRALSRFATSFFKDFGAGDFNVLRKGDKVMSHHADSSGYLNIGGDGLRWMSLGKENAGARVDIIDIRNPTGRKAYVLAARVFPSGGKSFVKRLLRIYAARDGSAPRDFQRERLIGVYESFRDEKARLEDGVQPAAYILPDVRLGSQGNLNVSLKKPVGFKQFPHARVQVKVMGNRRFVRFIRDDAGRPILDGEGLHPVVEIGRENIRLKEGVRFVMPAAARELAGWARAGRAAAKSFGESVVDENDLSEMFSWVNEAFSASSERWESLPFSSFSPEARRSLGERIAEIISASGSVDPMKPTQMRGAVASLGRLFALLEAECFSGLLREPSKGKVAVVSPKAPAGEGDLKRMLDSAVLPQVLRLSQGMTGPPYLPTIRRVNASTIKLTLLLEGREEEVSLDRLGAPLDGKWDDLARAIPYENLGELRRALASLRAGLGENLSAPRTRSRAAKIGEDLGLLLSWFGRSGVWESGERLKIYWAALQRSVGPEAPELIPDFARGIHVGMGLGGLGKPHSLAARSWLGEAESASPALVHVPADGFPRERREALKVLAQQLRFPGLVVAALEGSEAGLFRDLTALGVEKTALARLVVRPAAEFREEEGTLVVDGVFPLLAEHGYPSETFKSGAMRLQLFSPQLGAWRVRDPRLQAAVILLRILDGIVLEIAGETFDKFSREADLLGSQA